MKNIFVAKLSFSTTETELRTLFEEYGDVTDVHIIKDKVTHKSKGYGFVEMYDDEAAERAINELDGYELKGRIIAVNEARPREERQ
ncbi:MAG: RNA-binding protein [Bacteroidales bacterium]|nr:RNA-binding protein [Bacteroidales bacterium]